MEIEKLFLISLSIYAMLGSVLFVTGFVVLIIVFKKTKGIMNKVERMTDAGVSVLEAAKTKIEEIDFISSIKKIILGYLRKE